MFTRINDLRKNNEAGLTLIEILVAVAIVAIVAVALVANFGGLKSSSQTKVCAADKATIESAEEAYNAQNDKYADEALLVSSGMLKTTSTNYDLTMTGTAPNYTAYTITTVAAPTGKC